MNVQLLEDQEWHRKSFLILLTSLRYLLRRDIHFNISLLGHMGPPNLIQLPTPMLLGHFLLLLFLLDLVVVIVQRLTQENKKLSTHSSN